MQFVVAWNYFKMLFIIAECYVLLGVFSYTAPLAFSTGGSKATNNVLASWSKMFRRTGCADYNECMVYENVFEWIRKSNCKSLWIYKVFMRHCV